MKTILKALLIASSFVMCATALAASSHAITVKKNETYGNGQSININLYAELPPPGIYDITCHINNTASVPVLMEAENIGLYGETITKDGYRRDYYMPQLRLMLNNVHGTRDHFSVKPGDNNLVVQHIDGWPADQQMKNAAIVLRDLAPIMIPEGGGNAKIIVHDCVLTNSPRPRNP